MKNTILAISFFIFAWSAPLSAEVMTYQGRLKESNVPVNANRSFLFEFCATETPTGCVASADGAKPFAVQNGLFKSTFTLPAVDLSAGPWYLRVKVEGSYLSPVERLTFVPYSLYASTAAYSPSAVQKAGDTMTGQLTLSGSTLTVTGSSFSVGGSTLVVVNGKVGIGTASPSAKLHVQGGGNGGVALRLEEPSPVGNFWQLETDASSGLAIGDSAGTRIRVNNLGNVGIGTTPPAYRLAVSSGAGEAGKIVTVSTGTTNVFWVDGFGANALKFTGDGSGLTGVTGASGTDSTKVLKTGDTMSGPLTLAGSTLTVAGGAFSVGGSTLVVMNGNVGIGTAAPAARLDVAGSGNFSGSVTAFSSGTFKATGVNQFSVETSSGILVQAGRIQAPAIQLTNGAAANYVLASDAAGNASWVNPVSGALGDGWVGNEIVDAADASLARSGAGIAVDPYKLALNLSNANTWIAAQTFNAGLTGSLSGAASQNILKAGDTMSGPLTLAGSTLTVTGGAFSVGGSTLVVTSGYLGLGTNAPTARLHVISDNGNVHFASPNSQLIMNMIPQTYSPAILNNNGDGPLGFSIANNVQLWIDRQTRVGIGTQTPSYRLHVSSGAGESGIIMAVSTGTSVVFGVKGNGEVSAGKYYGDGSALTGVSGTDATKLPLAGGTIAGQLTLANSTLTVTGDAFSVGGSTLVASAGRVGIGTASPSATLEIQNNSTSVAALDVRMLNPGGLVPAKFINSNNGQTIVEVVRDYGTTYTNADRMSLYVNSADAGIYTDKLGTGVNRPLVFKPAGVEALRLAVGGSVGIGTTGPSYRLHVSSGAGEAGTVMAVSTGATNLFWVAGDGAHAVKYSGDGSGLTNLPVPGGLVSIAGDTMIGQLTNTSSVTITGNGGIYGLQVSSNVSLAGALYSANGNVGIGGTAPGAKLDVYSSNTTSFLEVHNASILGKKSFRVFQSNNHGLLDVFDTAETVAVRLNADNTSPSYINAGNVGIGTALPDQKLTVAGNISQTGVLISSGIGNNYFSGNVGVGTASPQKGLHVMTNAIIESTSPGLYDDGLVISRPPGATPPGTAGYGGVAWRTGDYSGISGASTLWLGLRNTSNNWFLIGPTINNTGTYIAASRPEAVFELKRDDSDKFEFYVPVNFGRNVGVGTSAPQSHLQIDDTLNATVAGSANLALLVRHNAITAGAGPGIGFSSDNTPSVGAKIVHIRTGSNSQGDLAFYTKTNNAVPESEKVRIRDNGDVGISTGAPQARLDVLAGGATQTDMAQLWRNSAGTIVSSVSATGVMMAAKFIGDGSALAGVSATDNTKLPLAGGTMAGDITMGGNDLYAVSTITVTGDITAARYQIAGSNVLAVLPGTGSLGVGGNAGRLNVGSSNSFLGYSAGYSNTTGSNNSFLGFQAGAGNTSGGSNSFLGSYAGFNNTTGGSNSFLGAFVGYNNTTGGNNSFLGFYAGNYNTTGDNNSFLGSAAGYNTKAGSANVVFGVEAGYGVLNNSFSSSTLMGYRAGFGLTTGSDNILLGFQAGYNVTNGTGNIVIGYNKDTTAPGANNQLNIGGVLYGDLSAKTMGISKKIPEAALDIISTGTAANVYAQIWRDSLGVVVASMTATGRLSGDGSGLTGVTASDPTRLPLSGGVMSGNLGLGGNQILGVSTITIAGENIVIGPYSSDGNYAYAISIGSASRLNYDSGIGVGYGAFNNYTNGVGIGRSADTNNTYGVGVGNMAHSNSNYGTGIGYYANTNNTSGVGVGRNASGNSNFAVGIGAYSQNNQPYGSALGAYSYAASSSAALGSYAKANAKESIAIGAGTVNNSTGTANFGNYAIVTSSNIISSGAGNNHFAGNVGVGAGVANPGGALQVGLNGIIISTGGAIQTTGLGHGFTAGSARGVGAVDLQTNRTVVGQVASGLNSVLGGGLANTSSGDYATVSGGQSNTATQYAATVSGGWQNAAGNNYASVSGGISNTASGFASSVSGGRANTASGDNSFVGGGGMDGIGGGGPNIAQGKWSAVAGGNNNTASQIGAAVVGGEYNVAKGMNSFIGGGGINVAAGWGSVAFGANSASMADYTFAAGKAATSAVNGTFTWADSSSEGAVNNVLDQVMFKAKGGFWISTGTVYADPGLFVGANNNVGLGTTSPSVKFHNTGPAILANSKIIDPDNYGSSVIAGWINDLGYSASAAIGGMATNAGTTWAIGHDNAKLLFGAGDATNPNTLQTFMQVSANRDVVFVPVSGNVGIGVAVPGAKLDVAGDIRISMVGKGLRVMEGSNARMGTVALTAGTAIVSNTSVTASTRIFLTAQSGGAPGALYVSARTAGTSFTITSTNVADTSLVAWLLVEP